MAEVKEYLDYSGLKTYDEAIKKYIKDSAPAAADVESIPVAQIQALFGVEPEPAPVDDEVFDGDDPVDDDF